MVDALRSGANPNEACARGLGELSRVRGEGGVIAVSRRGEVGFAFNTQRMSRAFITDNEKGAAFS